MQGRAFGTPDFFVWAPVLGLLEAAAICVVILQSTAVALALIAAAVALVVFESWANRPMVAARPQPRPRPNSHNRPTRRA
ncbi:hypothetical protein [Nocardia otitidiscaviarum]|uniref:hypothetical protein n=1 Tax=Nocardia otitidiscaviarum TaxID=1823 RepID=UPI002453EA8E|nr:hypothetical protein [Nocardia otitidiscaviarum]